MIATSSADTPRVNPTVSLGDALRGHSNSLGLIRLVMAALVIVDHAFPLGGFGHDPFWDLTNGQASLGSIAVGGFFAISGYLIVKSGMSSDVLQFLWRRVLRIFPAYWAVLLFAAFVVGPIIWVLDGHSFASYFSLGAGGPVFYFTSNWTLQIGTYGIYDIFRSTTPYGLSVDASVFNGSLWTLYYEFVCYLLIALLLVFGVLAKARIVVPILTAIVFSLQIGFIVDYDATAAAMPLLADPQMLNLVLTFLLGSCLAVYSKSIPFDDRLGIGAGIVLAFTLATGGYAFIGLPLGAYFVMYLAARLGGRMRRVGAVNDYSYGVYIYGFLVQQVLAYFKVYELGYVPFLIFALVGSLGLAWLSWHLVEKRAMSLKDWGPGKGIGYWWDRGADRLAALKTRR